MRKIILTVVAMMTIVSASAQISAYKQGNSASIEGYSLPRTVITVTVTQEREVVLRGPYAKYASQYLGISSVAQNDKESYKLIGATLGYYEEPDPKQVYLFDEKSGAPTKIFNWLTFTPPTPEQAPADKDFSGAQTAGIVPFTDMGTSVYGQTQSALQDGQESYRTSAVEKSPEQMAADAAATIFKIRQRRLDLITGEMGEGVFGAGLEAALKEMARLEAEYLSLFIGKRFTQRTVQTFNVVPTSGKNRITAFRFSDSKGVVADTDVSGRPINIELTPEIAETRPMESTVKKGRTVVYRIPLVEFVKLTDGQELLSTMRIPVFQLGSMVDAPVVFSAQ